jgi:AAA ATPase domain
VDARANPYTPGAGVRPAELAGRANELEDFDVLLERVKLSRPVRSDIYYGLRGVGKTVLLNEMQGRARLRNWIAAKVEAELQEDRTPFRNQLAGALNQALRQVQPDSRSKELFLKALRTFKSFSLKASPDGSLSIGIDIDDEPGVADTGSLPLDLTELALSLGEAARESGIGALLFIDEMQNLSIDDLAAICQACHQSGQQNLPFIVVGTGLPNLPGLLAEAKSYSERLFDFGSMGALEGPAAHEALITPALREGVEWSDEAEELVMRASGGYPYFIQQFGETTWNAAATSPISADDARVGIRDGQGKLDRGFYLARWERATPAEREYLAAMSADGDGPSASGEIAARLGKRVQSLGPARSKLISKGLIYAPDHGLIAFSVPGMASFVDRQSLA